MKRSFSLFGSLGAYVLLSGLLYLRDFRGGPIFQPTADPFVYIWCLNWWPFAISHGLNPSISRFIWSPTGFPMWWANSIPTLAVLLAPITLTFGAVKSWNFIMLVAPAANAFGCNLFLRYLTKNVFASFVGGLIFGFASYVTAEQLGHVSLSLVPFVPLVALLVIRRGMGDVGRWSYVALMSGMAVLQFGLSTEILASAAFFGLIAFLVFFKRYKNVLDLVGLAKDTVVAGLIAMAVLSPALYFMAIGANELPAVINSPNMFSADLLNILIPNPTIWLGGDMFKSISSQFPGNFSEQGAYIGIGIFVVAIFAITYSTGQRWNLPLILMLLIVSVASLGPILWIGGHNTGIHLPWTIFTKVPIIRHALPTRFTLYSSLILSVYIGIWLSEKLNPNKLIQRYLATLLSFVFLVPNAEWFKFGSVDTPNVFSEQAVQGAFGSNANIVVLPFGYLGNSMLWQLESGMKFRMAGGYVGFSPQSLWRYKAMMYFYDAEQAPGQEAFNQAVSDFCRENGVTAIAIAPGTSRNLASAVMKLPWQKYTYGDTTIVKVPVLN